MPALMLLFPADDCASAVETVPEASRDAAHTGIYTLDGRCVASCGAPRLCGQLASGLYVTGGRKLLVR